MSIKYKYFTIKLKYKNLVKIIFVYKRYKLVHSLDYAVTNNKIYFMCNQDN